MPVQQDPQQTDAASRTLGEVERGRQPDAPGGRGVPDERQTFASDREDNLKEGRQAAAQVPRHTAAPEGGAEGELKSAASDTLPLGERGGPSPR